MVRWTVLIPPILLLAAVADGQGYNYGLDVNKVFRRQADKTPYVVRGLGRINGTTPLRPEYRDLEKNFDKFVLFRLGLSMLQFSDQSEMLSWYKVAGIHGVPWESWNGVETLNKDTAGSGYCQHISVLFPPWHRVYMSLYEQVLYDRIQWIASLWPEGPERNRWQAAAVDFRIPYLDWAAKPPAGESVLPKSISESPSINITGPNGVQEIANPLYSYRFKPFNSSIFILPPYNQWPLTVRAPTTNDSAVRSNNTRVSMTLDQNFPSFQQRVYNLLSNSFNYSRFSNEGWVPLPTGEWSQEFDSLESLHDTIHTLTGLQGHMMWIPFSAFDPLFWLHHVAVDRLFAMWQVLHPTSYVEPTTAVLATYTTAHNATLTSKTPLTPFYAKDDGTFWDSDMARDLEPFGYSYAEVAAFPAALKATDPAAQAQVRAAVNRLYGTSSPAGLKLAPGPPLSPRYAPRPGTLGRGSWNARTDARPPPGSVLVDDAYREWVAHVRARKMGLDGSYLVHLFLGAPPAGGPRAWSYAPNLVGTMSVFAAPAAMMRGGMAAGMGAVFTTGTVPLTSALVRQVTDRRLASLRPDVVVPFLQENLACRVVRADGTEAALENVPGLAVRVASTEVQAPASEEELPSWGRSEHHFDLILAS